MSIIGPNEPPMLLLPKRWNTKSITSIITMMGTVLIPGFNCSKPSIAEETLIGGVIMPSASKALPPIIAGTINHPILVRLSRAYRAKIPPSPLLSALSVSIIYFTVVCSVNVQKMQDKEPKITSLESDASLIIACKTYKGEVPMSPYTMPRVISNPAAVILFIPVFLWSTPFFQIKRTKVNLFKHMPHTIKILYFIMLRQNFLSLQTL